jgi:hypothetical protein
MSKLIQKISNSLFLISQKLKKGIKKPPEGGFKIQQILTS